MATADQGATAGELVGSRIASRMKMTIRGAVQGVGMRPFIYRLATELELAGWVLNNSSGVRIEVEGPRARLDDFLLRVEREKPPISFIQSLESSFADAVGYVGFEIRHSDGDEAKTALVMPDVATCPDCLREILDPANRRFGYPFTNCTNCGPRYSIIESLPYDRPRTTMKKFIMCAACAGEYGDPRDRRFHAQPNACPVCGPHLELWAMSGHVEAQRADALAAAAEAIRCGAIVGVKGLGGFHLMVDARNTQAVEELRRRKHREEKPFALMFPALETVAAECEVTPLEERLLRSPEAPIVLLWRSQGGPLKPVVGLRGAAASALSEALAPGNPMLGVMLPYTPLHHLLMRQLGFAVVATSGNLSDEPICIDEHEALARLQGIADLLLVHNRPILRHVDDSIVRVMAGREMVMRRARGFAPLPVLVAEELPPLLGVGAQQKNAVALAVGRQVFLSQHIGDLETAEANAAFERTVESLESLYESRPTALTCDLHPNYLATEYAHRRSQTPIGVQHHYAHILGCMAENDLQPPVLGVAWDGSGWGPDGTVWGGEFLKIDTYGYTRVARLRPFRLPGSERAVREPRRCALSLLWQSFEGEIPGELAPIAAFSEPERRIVLSMLDKGLNSPWTSSAGRLFDAAASLIGVRQIARHEGQAAMELEWLAARENSNGIYPFELLPGSGNEPGELDWRPMIRAMLAELAAGATKQQLARHFHNTLAEMIAALAAAHPGLPVALSGGCFQNRLLTELTIARLQAAGARVYWHQRVPPNDGGIALGQVLGAARQLRFEASKKESTCV